MSTPQKAVAYIEMEDYLVLEEASRYRHEYLDGVVYAVQGEPVRGMAGGTATHADVIGNVGFALRTKLRGSPCRVKMSKMRLRIDDAEACFYPDVLVHCTQPERPDKTTELTEARLVVEVLSRSTQHFDRADKLAAYRKLPGLQHVVLVSGMEQAVWAAHRVPASGAWSQMAAVDVGAALPLAGLGIDLGWAEIYDGVGLGQV